jgi:hypothetical protein
MSIETYYYIGLIIGSINNSYFGSNSAMPQHNMMFYIQMELIPLYISLLVILLYLMYGVILYLMYGAIMYKKETTTSTVLLAPKKLLVFLGRVTFSGPSGLLHYYKRAHDCKKVYIGMLEVPDKILIYLGCYVLLCALVIFSICWNLVFIDRSSGFCDGTKQDCFNTSNPMHARYVNCSWEDQSTSTSIACFSLFGDILNEYQALLAFLGGMLPLTKVVMMLISQGFLKYYSLAGTRLKCCTVSLSFLKVVHLVGLGLATIIILGVAIIFSLQYQHLLVQGGQIFLVLASFYVASFIPWRFFMLKEVKERVGMVNTYSDDEAVVVTHGENPLDVTGMPGCSKAKGGRRRVVSDGGSNFLCSLSGKRSLNT